ncbi:MAG: DNA methyltransferase [Acidobacteria bacterium]|nr:DNA methyltransferase [Acidobacteriota bacterium]
MTEAWAKDDALATYHEACRLAADGHAGVREWFTGGRRYGAILADPPWSFKSWSDKGKDRCPDAMVRQKGLAERHYKTMGLADIKALPVADIAARDSVLILWVVDCMLPEGLDVGAAWGFRFKTTGFTWQKTTQDGRPAIGLGYWGRGQTEQCLLFTRGKPRRLSAGVRKLIIAPRREHSRKPDEQYERIEALAAGPYVELFARRRRAGWDSWGNQLEIINDQNRNERPADIVDAAEPVQDA